MGYKCSIIYIYYSNWIISVYCEPFLGNKGEHSIFKETFKHFFELYLEMPKVVLADAAPHSAGISRWLFEMGIVPLINLRKSVKKQNVVRLTKNFCLNIDFIPSEWTKEDLIKMMIIRTEIERQFSHDVVACNARRANACGLEMVSKHRY